MQKLKKKKTTNRATQIKSVCWGLIKWKFEFSSVIEC